MSVATVGAQSITKEEKQCFSCVIKKIVCHYPPANDQSGQAVLYSYDKADKDVAANNGIQDEPLAHEGVITGGISVTHREYDYYFISNHKGKEIMLECTRVANCCTDDKHSKFDIDYIDIESHGIKTECRGIADGKVKLYYFNLFHRAGEYASASAEYMWNDNTEAGIVSRGALAATGYVAGKVAGDVVDFLFALRFIHLPDIKDNDAEYECHTSLFYKECPHIPSVPPICIHIYPDIEYSLKIDFKGVERTYYADNGKKDTSKTTPLSFEFNVTYASVKKALKFDNTNDEELDAEEQKGSVFYKTINTMSNCLKEAARFTQNLKSILQETYGDDASLVNDTAAVGQAYDKIGTKLGSSSSWLSGSLNIQPALSALWRYSVSDDLSELKRHLELEFNVACEGALTIDIVRLCRNASKKAKKATTVLAAGAAVASGGLASLPAVLIKFLIDYVLEWLTNKLLDGLKFDVIFFGNVELQCLSYNSSRDTGFEGAMLSIEPGIKIVAGADYKCSISPIVSIKATGELKALIHASAALTLKFEFKVQNGVFGINQTGEINPFTIKVEFSVVGAYDLFIYSNEQTFGGKPHEWKFAGHEMKPHRFDFFKVDNATAPKGGVAGQSW